MIRHPEPPPRAVPMRVATVLIGTAVVLAVIGIALTAWASVGARRNLESKFKAEIAALEAQVRTMCQATPDPATCKAVTQAPIVLVVPATTMVTPTTVVPFPPSTLAPAATAPANPPASAAQASSPAPQPSTTTTTAAPPPTTTPPTTAPCTSLPVVGCMTRASRSATRSTGCGGWEEHVADAGDWNVADVCSVMRCESGFDPDAANGRYHGLMQVDGGSFDGVTNLAQAFALWNESRTWRRWSCKPA